jgi:hypothetical protein
MCLGGMIYLLNLVHSKSVPKILVELWLGQKPSMRCIHIWGCLAHMLKRRFDKLEPKEPGVDYSIVLGT